MSCSNLILVFFSFTVHIWLFSDFWGLKKIFFSPPRKTISSFDSRVFTFARWVIFIVTALKFLSDNSSGRVISALHLRTVFSHTSSDFLVLHRLSDFGFDLGHFVYYMMRLWFLFKRKIYYLLGYCFFLSCIFALLIFFSHVLPSLTFSCDSWEIIPVCFPTKSFA